MATRRYSITSDTVPLGEMEKEARAVAATEIKVARHSGVVFADLTDDQVRRLSDRLHVARVREVRPDAIKVPPEPMSAAEGYSVYSLSLAAEFEGIRAQFTPPLTGANARVAILDTGISPHEAIGDRVIWEKDYTGLGSTRDDFDHGTAVASMVAGIAPGVSLLNCRVLGPTGEGSEEPVVMAIEDLIDLVLDQDPRYPTMINLSLGTPEEGDRDNPLRRAIRAAIHLGVPEELPGPHNIITIAAAGNYGPDAGTVGSPACEEEVVAVGGLTTTGPLQVARYSSRGPTTEGLVKPDVMFFAQDIVLASSTDLTAYKVRSGTSFASPAIAGIIAFSVELGWRLMGEVVPIPGEPGREAYPEPTWTVADMFGVLPVICAKAEGAPVAKDNAWGYGMPFGSLVMKAFQVPALPLMDMMAPFLGLAMMGMVMKAMVPRE